MAELVVEALFVVVFCNAFVAYVRTRDRLHRDVMLVFSALAALFVIGLARQIWDEPLRLAMSLAAAWLLGQPYWTLRLAAQLRQVPRWVMWAAAAGWAGTAVPVILSPGPLPGPAVLAAVVVFLATQLTAAVLFALDARVRTGAPRMRLWCAAAATGLFAVAIAVTGMRSAYPDYGRLISAAAPAIGCFAACSIPRLARAQRRSGSGMPIRFAGTRRRILSWFWCLALVAGWCGPVETAPSDSVTLMAQAIWGSWSATARRSTYGARPAGTLWHL
jgi:hypothetical protein